MIRQPFVTGTKPVTQIGDVFGIGRERSFLQIDPPFIDSPTGFGVVTVENLSVDFQQLINKAAFSGNIRDDIIVFSVSFPDFYIEPIA